MAKEKLKTHYKENNEDSERHLHENELKFSNQCKKVLVLLRQGKVLSSRSAMIDYNIGDVHRRISELKNVNNVEGISDEWVHDDEGKTKYKIWYMPEFCKSKKPKPPGVKVSPTEVKEPKKGFVSIISVSSFLKSASTSNTTNFLPECFTKKLLLPLQTSFTYE